MSVYVQKPPLGSQINWGHPLSKNLVGCWLMNEGGGLICKDRVNNINGTVIGGKPWSPSIKGIGLKTYQTTLSSGSVEYIATNSNMGIGGVVPSTIVMIAKSSSLSQTAYQDQNWYCHRGWYYYGGTLSMNTGGALSYKRYNTSSANYALRTTNNIIVAGKTYIVVVTYDGSTTASNIHIYVNGVECSYATTTDGAGTLQSQGGFDWGIGRTDTGNGYFAGTIISGFAFKRILSLSEIQSLNINSYQFILRPSRIIYSIPSGAVNASVTQVGVSLTLSVGTQSIASVRNVAISQVSASLTLGTGTHTIAAVRNVAITQVLKALTLTAGTQTVAATTAPATGQFMTTNRGYWSVIVAFLLSILS